MATAFEDQDSPRSIVLDGKNAGCERAFTIIDATDENDAHDAVVAVAPEQFQGLAQTLARQPFTLDYVGGGVYRAKVKYLSEASGGSNDYGELTKFKLSFDTSGETTKKFGVAPDKQLYYMWEDLTAPAPDIRGALGWNGKNAEGVDVVVPGLKLTLTAEYRADRVDAFQVKAWSRATGKTNSDYFLGFAPGELLNLGCRGDVALDAATLKSVEPVSVAFSFLASENILTPYNEGDVLVQRKGGHEHVQAMNIEYDDADGKKASRVAYVWVSTVYPSTSFAALTGIYS